MQFKSVERGSDKRDRSFKTRHRINRAHPLFCEVSPSQVIPAQTQWFFKFNFDQPLE